MSKKLTALTSATTPLAGTESLYLVQGGNSRVTTTASFYIPGGTDVPVADGGTGASTDTAARTNLGVAIGSDVQAYSANLDAWSALATSAKQDASANLDGWSAIAPSTKQDADANLTTLSSGTTTLGATGLALLAAGSAAAAIAELNVKALNADGGFTAIHTQATELVEHTPFGGLFDSAAAANDYHLALASGVHTGPRFTMALTLETPGGNPNGPGSAGIPLWINSAKSDWLNSSANGEIDGAYILAAQGANGDMGGLLIHTKKVESASYGSVGIEMTHEWVQAATGTPLRTIRAMMGGHIPSSDVRQGGLGFQTFSTVGNNRTGYLVYEDGGTLTYMLLASTTKATGNDVFHVTGSGHPDGAGRLRTADGSAATPSLSFVTMASAGFYKNGAGVIGVASSGVNIANLGPNGLRIGTGVIDQGAGTLNVSGAYYVDDTLVVDASRGIRHRSYTGTQLSTATDAVNTTDKVAGKAVWHSNNSRVLYAAGSGATDNWVLADGTTAITPS